MAGIRQGFFTTSSQAKNEEEKQNTFFQPYFYFQLTLFLIIIEQVIKNDQHCNETYLIGETEKVSEVRITPEGFRVQSFSQMNMEQLIKVVLNLQEEVKKLRKENTKLTEFINNGLQDMLDLRLANQEREIDAL